jgi:hypothetical protein
MQIIVVQSKLFATAIAAATHTWVHALNVRPYSELRSRMRGKK